jgi:competence protein CoiA
VIQPPPIGTLNTSADWQRWRVSGKAWSVIMKFALVEGRRLEAQPGLSGECPVCGSAMVPKCGERRVWHWAHRGALQCDHWWENETEWHRNWKNKFPADWQEMIHWAENGEKHIADVKPTHGRVIELQHSYLEPEERRSREAFYGSMVWVVNGLRRKRDKPSFYKTLCARQVIRRRPLSYLVPSNRCALLRDWFNSRVGVFFDFGIAQEDIDLFGVPVLWRLSPKSPNDHALLTPVPVVNFIEAFLKGTSLKGFHAKVIQRTIEMPRVTPYWRPRRPRGRPISWPQYRERIDRARSRRRM